MRDVMIVVELVVDDDVTDEQIQSDVEDALEITIANQEQYDDPIDVVAISEGTFVDFTQPEWRRLGYRR